MIQDRVAPGFLDRLLHLLLPAPCLGCDLPLPARPSPLGLCEACRRELPEIPPDAPGCARCGRPLEGTGFAIGWRCGECRRRPPAFDRLLAVWSYEPPVDRVILGLKFRRREHLGRHLGERMAARLELEQERDPELAATLKGPVGVVPVPLHWRRRLARGYNQAEEIARPLAARLRWPLRRCLRRCKATPRQTALPRERRHDNPRDAFRCPRRPPERTIVLVDDVTTTGATLRSAAQALRKSGAETVVALVAARTPPGGSTSTNLA